MPEMIDNYRQAVREFEELTERRAQVLKNKGREQGLRKIRMLFKTGKTLEQRVLDFEAARRLTEKARKEPEVFRSLTELELARTKLVDGLKANMAAFSKEMTTISPDDTVIKAGFEAFVKRLSQIANRARMESEQRRAALKQQAGSLSPDDKLNSDLRTIAYNIRKGCDETEALMRVFIAKPSRDTFFAAFSSGTGPRSIGVAVTNWKLFVLPQRPELRSRLVSDPETLLAKIADLTQKKAADYWTRKLQLDQRGWEQRATNEAKAALAQVGSWRIMADEIKKLAA